MMFNRYGGFGSGSLDAQMYRTRRASWMATFGLVCVLILVSAILGGPGAGAVVLLTAASITSGFKTSRYLMSDVPWIRRRARLGVRRILWMAALAGVFVAVLAVQVVLIRTVGPWPAAAMAPVAFVVEFLLARESLGAKEPGKLPQNPSPL
jgi:archaellum biogenesis protein FlaJ (TadC family)